MKYLLVVQDNATGFTVLRALPNTNTSIVKYELKYILSLIGFPIRKLLRDDEKILTNYLINNMIDRWNPGYKLEDYKVDKVVSQVKDVLEKLESRAIAGEDDVDEDDIEKLNWVTLLPNAMMEINNKSYPMIFGMQLSTTHRQMCAQTDIVDKISDGKQDEDLTDTLSPCCPPAVDWPCISSVRNHTSVVEVDGMTLKSVDEADGMLLPEIEKLPIIDLPDNESMLCEVLGSSDEGDEVIGVSTSGNLDPIIDQQGAHKSELSKKSIDSGSQPKSIDQQGAKKTELSKNSIDSGSGPNSIDQHGAKKSELSKNSINSWSGPKSQRSHSVIKQAFLHPKCEFITVGGAKYPVVYPYLRCQFCDTMSIHGTPGMCVSARLYYDRLAIGTLWWTADVVTTFGVLKAHSVHRKDMIFMDAGTPTRKEKLPKRTSDLNILPNTVKSILTVATKNKHFVVLQIKLHPHFTTVVYDGRSSNDQDLPQWSDHQDYVLSRCGIAKDAPNRQWVMRHHLPHLDLGNRIVIRQKDDYNCGPIACKVLWELLTPSETKRIYCDGSREKPDSLAVSDWRWICANDMKSLIIMYEKDMWLKRRKKRGHESQE